MNVLFLSHSFPRYEGDAAGAFVLRFAEAMKEAGVNVHVIAPAAQGVPREDEIRGITVERFRYAPARLEKLAYTGNMASDVAKSWSARLALLSFMGADFAAAVRSRRKFAIDVVHAHWWFPGGLVGTWVSGITHAPLVTTLHGTDVRLARRVSMARPLFRHVLTSSKAVTAVSSWLADLAVETASVPKPIVAPMPVSTELFSPDGAGQRSGLLFVGRLNRQKGLEHLLRAMPAMRSGTRLEVIGDGPQKGQLRELAAELGVADRVAWHQPVRQAELADRYRRAAAVVMPSIGEGLGMVAVEAALCETPVVAFDSGGLKDVVRDGSTGVRVPPEDSAALARAADDILASPERARELGRAARIHALSNFAPESVAQRYLRIYEKAVAGSAA